MTNHYNIEILETQTHLKVTYRDNKFRKLEHLRGKIDDAMLRQLGRIIPRLEASMESFKTHFEAKVSYTKIETEKSTYTLFLDEWTAFFEQLTGLPPKFTGADGNSLKSIITYLKKLSAGSEPEALALWKIILSKWHTIKEFHQQNTDLKYINSKLNIILHEIKQQGNTFTQGTNGSVEL
ncbi:MULTISPECIES: hypothetical protein [Bizionia]|uniref:Uncharacterized protein n=1 Tax=Bizionia algoritergicola TaxID=291187 RepID=A0A5D0R235_9FLAO|nr:MULTISPECIES: hypothetical protein [Bizionia]OBX17817.1 hypothetical protein BAA08_15795 [Bizionia sp. APA-3]TYB74564.1 hypothetical protein ES675_00010 [Bizionia algoritergicola]